MDAAPHDTAHIGHLVRIPYQAVSGEILRRLHAAGFDDLRAAHLVVFQHVRREGSRLTTLAALAQMTPQSMGYLVDGLEERGYVERRPDPRDRRASLVCLTTRGWDEVRCALQVIADIEREWADALGPDDFDVLRGLLGRLCERLAPLGYV